MTSEIEDATKWIGEWIGLSASMIRSGEDFTPRAEEVHKKARASLSAILTALAASQAKVEKLARERNETLHLASRYAAEAGEAKGRLEMSEVAGIVDDWRQCAVAAEARATRAEALVKEAGEVLGSAAVELDAVVQAMVDGAATGLNAAGLHRLRQRVIARLRAARAFRDKLKGEG